MAQNLDAVRVISTASLGDTLLQQLGERLGSLKHPDIKTAWISRLPTGSESDIAAAVRDALKEILGSDSRIVAFTREDPLVDRTMLDLVERVPPIVHARRDRLSEENIQVLVDSYLRTEPTFRARHAIEHDNARERARFVEEVACLTSRDLAELAGHKAENSSATAARWKKAKRVFALPWRGSDIFPAFQFTEGKPRGVIADVLAALPEMSPWQTAFWFTSSNSWLDGASPVDRLGDTEQVLIAAHHEGEGFAG